MRFLMLGLRLDGVSAPRTMNEAVDALPDNPEFRAVLRRGWAALGRAVTARPP